MKGVSLFAGIGGLDLGFERAGGETILQVEIDPFCQKVLAKHWPHVRRISDVHEVTAADCEGADVIFGGSPCQPVSLAGERQGDSDERWLWPDFARLIGEVRPRYAVMENVPGLVSLGLDGVIGDLAALGYDAEWGIISACAVGAPHTRERVFIVAHHGSTGGQRFEPKTVSRFPGFSWCQDVRGIEDIRIRPDLPPSIFRGTRDGVPDWLDRLHALGNAVVPQVAEYVFNRLFEFDRMMKEQ